ELAGKSPQEVHDLSRLDEWRQLARIRKPLIAAVNGMALGGGCELAMVCDIIIAGEDAVFALPETGLGLMPGGGGTQRLIRAVGKSVAMDMILTGRRLKARDALGFGLIARVAPNELVLDLAVSVGEHIAARPRDAVARAKYAVLLAENLALATGIEHERRLFESLFESNETQEKMRSFLDDRASKPPGRIP
ncbi:MAG: enoyl-CoA hydratase-related protein, partial [Thermomicrobiales bacterium]